jgi:hypothetical protein
MGSSPWNEENMMEWTCGSIIYGRSVLKDEKAPKAYTRERCIYTLMKL